MIEEERINWVNGVWEDGEWVSWETIGQEIEDEGICRSLESLVNSMVKLSTE
jgi:hypothetical protein